MTENIILPNQTKTIYSKLANGLYHEPRRTNCASWVSSYLLYPFFGIDLWEGRHSSITDKMGDICDAILLFKTGKLSCLDEVVYPPISDPFCKLKDAAGGTEINRKDFYFDCILELLRTAFSSTLLEISHMLVQKLQQLDASSLSLLLISTSQ